MTVIGSRGSALALAQSGWVRDMILSRFPGIDVAVKIIKTSADKSPAASIRASSSIGVFVKELEQALVEEEIDIAVHSMKDLPTTIQPQLEIAAIPGREDARDALIARESAGVIGLPPGAVVGTGSIRRQSQLLAMRPDLKIVDIRGNVDTRLNRLQKREYDAIILACAGLNRLGLQDRITTPLDFSQMLPAPGQGALAIEIRRQDARTAALVTPLNDRTAEVTVSAERMFLHAISGGCNVPAAVHARMDGAQVLIEGLVASPDGKQIVRDSVRATTEAAVEAAASLANLILARGGRAILDRL